jgi:hypothetical protein
MDTLNSVTSLVLIALAVCLVIWITANFLWNLRRDRTPFGKKLWRYIRDVLDALWGAG